VFVFSKQKCWMLAELPLVCADLVIIITILILIINVLLQRYLLHKQLSEAFEAVNQLVYINRAVPYKSSLKDSQWGINTFRMVSFTGQLLCEYIYIYIYIRFSGISSYHMCRPESPLIHPSVTTLLLHRPAWHIAASMKRMNQVH